MFWNKGSLTYSYPIAFISVNPKIIIATIVLNQIIPVVEKQLNDLERKNNLFPNAVVTAAIN